MRESIEPPSAVTRRFNISDRETWRAALAGDRPVLVHLNADTTWLIQIPYPGVVERPPGRSHFNILIDPWLQGPQSDVASWFSTQWHIVESSMATMAELNSVLGELEGSIKTEARTTRSEEVGAGIWWFIDAVLVSHEFTDHCHQATLEELPKSIPVVAGDQAAKLIDSWGHFDHVKTAPPFSSSSPPWREALADCHDVLPSWLAVGRIVRAGNALYYHSAVMIAFRTESASEAILYSPHGIDAQDVAFLPESGVRTVALMHGLHDVRIWMTKQLNLGALNGIRAVRASGARYWVATHDEVKQGVGLISWFLQRTVYSAEEAAEAEQGCLEGETAGGKGETGDYVFLDLGAGDGAVLE